MPSIGKPLHHITSEDIQKLCDARAIEDEQIDFKEAVPFKGGRADDPWIAKRDLTDHGREQILAALVGFANSYGGDLVLGIKEQEGGSGRAGRAESIAPIPDCEDLAHRLGQLAAECIDPPLPSLAVHSIVTDGDKAGIIVLRTARSRLAPHRETKRNHAYHRSRHETRRLSMRQIQDMTLASARGLERVERRFSEVSADSRKWCDYHALNPGLKRALIRVTAVPLDPSVYVRDVYDCDGCKPKTAFRRLRVGSAGTAELYFPTQPTRWRPILRGMEADETFEVDRWRFRAFCDGTISYEHFIYKPVATDTKPGITTERTFLLHSGWLFAMLVNAMETGDTFRAAAGQPAAEYAIETEITNTHPLPFTCAPNRGTWVGGTFPSGSVITLPRLALGPRDTWSDFLDLAWRDFWNAGGVYAPETGLKLVD